MDTSDAAAQSQIPAHATHDRAPKARDSKLARPPRTLDRTRRFLALLWDAFTTIAYRRFVVTEHKRALGQVLPPLSLVARQQFGYDSTLVRKIRKHSTRLTRPASKARGFYVALATWLKWGILVVSIWIGMQTRDVTRAEPQLWLLVFALVCGLSLYVPLAILNALTRKWPTAAVALSTGGLLFVFFLNLRTFNPPSLQALPKSELFQIAIVQTSLLGLVSVSGFLLAVLVGFTAEGLILAWARRTYPEEIIVEGLAGVAAWLYAHDGHLTVHDKNLLMRSLEEVARAVEYVHTRKLKGLDLGSSVTIRVRAKKQATALRHLKTELASPGARTSDEMVYLLGKILRHLLAGQYSYIPLMEVPSLPVASIRGTLVGLLSTLARAAVPIGFIAAIRASNVSIQPELLSNMTMVAFTLSALYLLIGLDPSGADRLKSALETVRGLSPRAQKD